MPTSEKRRKRKARQSPARAGGLTREDALVVLAAAKRQMGQTRRLIQQIGAGTIAADDLKTVLLQRVHSGFTSLDTDGRVALQQLLLHLEGRTELLGMARGDARLGRQPGNTLVEGLIALAHHHGHWARPPEAWRPCRGSQHLQFASLSRHLFARYEVPPFMDQLWFRGCDAEARRQQGWFVHIGAGQNIRTADIPLRLTKKMAHHFLQAPRAGTVEEAFRWGQVLGLGGSPDLARAIAATRLGRSFEDEPFWSRFVQFLVRHPGLDGALIKPVVDYAYYRKYVPQEAIGVDGGIECGAPAEPNFSMKSRSLPKLLRQVERWRQRWTEDEPKAPTQWDLRRRRSAHFYLEEEDEASGRVLQWSIQELTTARSLANEGEAMSHCSASYSSMLGKMSLWSIQVREGDCTHRVMTLAVDNEQRVVTQARGRHNANPEREIGVSDAEWDGDRDRGWLSAADRYYLRRSHRIMELWLAREGIEYAPSGR